jgi:hypothetical protein
MWATVPVGEDESMTDADLHLIEVYSHSFIVRIWRDPDAEGMDGTDWRGYVIHVPSGKQHSLKKLGDILTFIAPYLTVPHTNGCDER